MAEVPLHSMLITLTRPDKRSLSWKVVRACALMQIEDDTWMSWLQAFFMGNWKSMFSAMRTSWSNSVALHS